MILAIDIGNTRIKCAVYEKDTLIDLHISEANLFSEEIDFFFQKHPKIALTILASVGKLPEKILSDLQKRTPVHFFDQNQSFPFKNNYASPKTLGIDRMILAAGAALQHPNQNKLVIDIGTCVTYDFIDKENIYHGGAISPGFRLRYQAMHNYTAKLPLLQLEEINFLIGNSTTQSMHSGVINGLTFEIDGYIDHLKSKHENFIIILTGGDANFLAKRLKNTIFANPNFLLDSLNQLYTYQISNV